MLENTEGAIKMDKETGNAGYIRRRKTMRESNKHK